MYRKIVLDFYMLLNRLAVIKAVIQTVRLHDFCSVKFSCSCSDTYEHHYSNKRHCGRAMIRRQCRSHIHKNPNHQRPHICPLQRGSPPGGAWPDDGEGRPGGAGAQADWRQAAGTAG